MYIIGKFLESNEVEVVPEEWLADPSTPVKTITDCWWPPYKSGKTTKAVTSREEIDASSWSKYSLKVLGRYETFDEARKKLPKATETSNVDTDEEVLAGRRKRRRNVLFEHDSSDYDSDEAISLPMPPQFKKKKITPTFSTPSCSKEVGEGTPTRQQTPTSHQNGHSNMIDSSMVILRRDVTDIKLKLNFLIESFENFKDLISKNLCNHGGQFSGSTEEEESDSLKEITEKFPLNEEDLLLIDNMLENSKIQNSLINYFKKYSGKSVKASIFTLLRMVFSDETAAKYSWVGGKKKKLFSTLRIVEAISDAIRARFKETTIPDIAVFVKTWLRNAPMRVLQKQQKS